MLRFGIFSGELMFVVEDEVDQIPVGSRSVLVRTFFMLFLYSVYLFVTGTIRTSRKDM